MIHQYSPENYTAICDQLARKDKVLKNIIKIYGYPPLWTRPQEFSTLILIILEQQVSLAAAYAAYKKLKERIGKITPQKIAAMTDEELRACYFTRQKSGYARLLAEAVLDKRLNLKKLALMPDEEIRTELKKHKGIGDWTVDIYLIQSLQRADIFPLGDLALVNSMKEWHGLDKTHPREQLLDMAEQYRPYRTLATMLYWHAYIQKRGIKVGE
jgi:DNA-3-methyladenine glycosylase II